MPNAFKFHAAVAELERLTAATAELENLETVGVRGVNPLQQVSWR
jgi:hypothetical protein